MPRIGSGLVLILVGASCAGLVGLLWKSSDSASSVLHQPSTTLLEDVAREDTARLAAWPVAPFSTAGSSEEREAAPSLLDLLIDATSIAELKQLLADPDPPADAAAQIAEYERDLRAGLEHDARRLRERRESLDPGDPERWLTLGKLQVEYLQTERGLLALLRGDCCFGTYVYVPHPRFEIWSWTRADESGRSLLVFVDRDQPPLYRQLVDEIDHYEKVTAFNMLNEGMRRRVLYLREKSLREDSPADQRWLAGYFPEVFQIDERTATIR